MAESPGNRYQREPRLRITRHILLPDQAQCRLLGRLLGVEQVKADHPAARDLHDARQDLLEQSGEVAAFARKQAQVKKSRQLIRSGRNTLLQRGNQLLDFGLCPLPHPNLRLQKRHGGGKLGGALGDLVFQAVVEAAQVLGLCSSHFGVVRHLEDLKALVGFFAGEQFLEGLVLFVVRKGLSHFTQLFTDL